MFHDGEAQDQGQGIAQNSDPKAIVFPRRLCEAQPNFVLVDMSVQCSKGGGETQSQEIRDGQTVSLSIETIDFRGGSNRSGAERRFALFWRHRLGKPEEERWACF